MLYNFSEELKDTIFLICHKQCLAYIFIFVQKTYFKDEKLKYYQCRGEVRRSGSCASTRVLMGFTILSLGVGSQIVQTALDLNWDWWGCWQKSTRWLVTVLVGNVADLHFLASGSKPGEVTMDVAMHVTGAGLLDVVVGFYFQIKAIRADILRSAKNFSVGLIIRLGHGQSEKGADQDLHTKIESELNKSCNFSKISHNSITYDFEHFGNCAVENVRNDR